MEKMRLEALRSYRILDTDPHPSFDTLTETARLAFGAPIAFISLLDADRQWFKSIRGLDITETARAHAMCETPVSTAETMVVPDLHEHAKLKDHPLVTGSPNVRFYAGAPIVDHEGLALGAMCVMDTRPRDFEARDIALLEGLAVNAMTAITAHHQGHLLREAARKLTMCCDAEPLFA